MSLANRRRGNYNRSGKCSGNGTNQPPGVSIGYNLYIRLLKKYFIRKLVKLSLFFFYYLTPLCTKMYQTGLQCSGNL